MLYEEDIVYNNFILKNLEEKDCNQNYLNWLNDENINRFLETRWYPQTIETIKSFVEDINKSDHSYLFGIFIRENGGGLCI